MDIPKKEEKEKPIKNRFDEDDDEELLNKYGGGG